MYIATGAYNENRYETNPVAGTKATFEIKETGKTTITAKTGSKEGYESKEAQKEIKLDNIKPEITKLAIEPNPRKSRHTRKSMDTDKWRNKNRSKRHKRKF